MTTVPADRHHKHREGAHPRQLRVVHDVPVQRRITVFQKIQSRPSTIQIKIQYSQLVPRLVVLAVDDDGHLVRETPVEKR